MFAAKSSGESVLVWGLLVGDVTRIVETMTAKRYKTGFNSSVHSFWNTPHWVFVLHQGNNPELTAKAAKPCLERKIADKTLTVTWVPEVQT